MTKNLFIEVLFLETSLFKELKKMDDLFKILGIFTMILCHYEFDIKMDFQSTT